MPREVVEPTLNERGDEEHPAFGMIGASRVTSNPGAVLFDSEIRHGHYVVLRIQRARRNRDLNRDWIHPDSWPLVEVAMSEAQWASFVSSMNTSGVPCTITHTKDEPMVPGMPYAPRLAHSMDYAHGAADEAFSHVKEAFEKVKEKPTKANIRDMEVALNNAVPNVDFAARTMAEHVENVVVKARADIETMVTRHAEQLGIEPGSYTAPLALGVGDDADEQ